MPLRVCLVSRELDPFWGAGIGVYAANMARAWAGAGHEVHVVTGRWTGLAERGRALLPGVALHAVRPAGAWPGPLRRVGPPDFVRYARAVRDAVRALHEDRPFDLIEVPDYWAEGDALLADRAAGRGFGGARVVARLHTPTAECRALNEEGPARGHAALLEAAEARALRLADRLVSPTRSLLAIVRARLGAPESRGVVVPYPFTPPAPAPLRGLPPETILFYGRLERRKGVHLLVEAARRVMDARAGVRLVMIGGDTATGPGGSSMRAHLASLVPPRHAGRVEIRPAVPRAELPGWIASAAVCALPSLWENFPNACLEAMSLGSVVVGSDAGGMGEIIEPGVSGLLFRSGDAGDLAGALSRALDDGELRARVRGAAPARVAALCAPGTIVRAMEALAAP